MTPVQIGHVRCSFALIEPIAPQAAALFYDNLFTAEPSLRRLFQGNRGGRANSDTPISGNSAS